MSVAKFLISSLAAAGFGHNSDGSQATLRTLQPDEDSPAAPRLFTQDHYFTLASHSSHRSHSSHASHSSGYSGGHFSHTSHRSSAGGYNYTSPAYVPSAPARTPAPSQTSDPIRALPAFNNSGRASPPPADDLPALSGRSKRFEAIVKRVQIALLAQGFYRGAIDGVVGPSLRGALRNFQRVRGIAVTGTITPPTLDALQIAAQ